MGDLFSALKFLVETLNVKKKNQEILKREISSNLRLAITETELYLSAICKKVDRNQEKENMLARHWSTLSGQSAPYDQAISDLFLKLSRFWTDPDLDLKSNARKHVYYLREILDDGRFRGVLYSGG